MNKACQEADPKKEYGPLYPDYTEELRQLVLMAVRAVLFIQSS